MSLYVVLLFWPGILRLYSIQSVWGLLRMDSDSILNLGNRLLITWVNKTCQIKDRYHPRFHFWNKSLCYVLYFTSHLFLCYFSFFCYFLWLFGGWSLFFAFVFMFFHSSLSNQGPTLTFLIFFDWLLNLIIIILSLLHYIIVYYLTKLHYCRLFYLLIPLLCI